MAGLIASQHDETREVLRLSNKFHNNLLLLRTISTNTITSEETFKPEKGFFSENDKGQAGLT